VSIPLKSFSLKAFLGNGLDPKSGSAVRHLPILSFLVRAPEQLGGFLHHNFVCLLLNDLVCQSKGSGKQVMWEASVIKSGV
jgi:hypothetical protein